MDVTTPGHNAFTSYGQNSYWATFRFNLAQDGGGWYGLARATSAAAPVLVGSIALMLQLNPNLTTAQVRQYLHSTARSDTSTGVTPNASWGWGKLDVNAALRAMTSPPPQPATP